MCQWRNVEYVMHESIKALQAGRLLSLEHKEPLPPSAYGYTRGHSSERFAKKSVIKSLNAFQRLLAYCSYALASCHWRGDRLHTRLDDFQSTFSVVYKNLPGSAHILAKRLFQTLWEVYTSSNFTGIVVRWERYDSILLPTSYNLTIRKLRLSRHCLHVPSPCSSLCLLARPLTKPLSNTLSIPLSQTLASQALNVRHPGTDPQRSEAPRQYL